jgi:hypothetical protein
MKDINHVILKTCKNLYLPKEKVKPLVDFYWNEVYRKLMTFESSTVHIREVGTITVSKFKLRLFLQKYILIIKRVLNSEKYPKEKMDEIKSKYFFYLRKLLKERDRIAKIYAKKFNNI